MNHFSLELSPAMATGPALSALLLCAGGGVCDAQTVPARPPLSAAAAPASPAAELGRSGGAQPAARDSLFDMSLGELAELPVYHTLSMSATARKYAPGVLNSLDHVDLDRFGARDLNDALYRLVPEAFVMHDPFGLPAVSLRGDFGNHRTVLMVNGLGMRNLGSRGTLTERDLPLLGDIRSIDVARGPAGSVHGSDALSGAFDITTHTGHTFTDTQFSLQTAPYLGLTTVEARHGGRLGPGAVFLYAGLADEHGAPQSRAPVFMAGGRPTFDGRVITTDQSVPFQTPPLLANYKGQLKAKWHAQYDDNHWQLWARYVRGGVRNYITRGTALSTAPLFAGLSTDMPDGTQYFYQQAVLAGTRRDSWDRNVDTAVSVSYDVLDFAHVPPADTLTGRSDRENHFKLAATLRWESAAQTLKAALGMEWREDTIGLRSIEMGQRDPQAVLLGLGPTSAWHVRTTSALGEVQWRPNESTIVFGGARWDQHTYARNSFAPRVMVSQQWTRGASSKLIYSLAHRFLPEAEVRSYRQSTPEPVRALPDRVRGVDWVNQFEFSDALHAKLSAWWTHTEQSDSSSVYLRYRQRGLEAAVDARSGSSSLSATYGLIVAPLHPSLVSTEHIASPPRHQLKLQATHRLRPDTVLAGTLVMAWDMGEQRRAYVASGGNLADVARAYGTLVQLNLSAEHRWDERWTLYLHARDLGALVHKRWSRQLSYEPGSYRTVAPSLGLNAIARF